MNSGSALGMVERSLMYGETDIDLGPATEPGPRYPGGGTHRFGLSWNADTGFATGGMTLYRSQGVQLQGRRGSDSKPTFEYQVGLWQGRSTSSLSNGGDNHLVAARVGYHPWGFVDWRVVGDVDHTQRFKLAVLGSVYSNSRQRPYAFDEGGYNLALMSRYRGDDLRNLRGRELQPAGMAQQGSARRLASRAAVRRRSRCRHRRCRDVDHEGARPGRLPHSRNGAARLLNSQFLILNSQF